MYEDGAFFSLPYLLASSAVSSSRSCVVLDSRKVETQDERLRKEVASFFRA